MIDVNDTAFQRFLQSVVVAIPTYNEAENITAITTRLCQAVPLIHILIVDDASPDGTGDTAEALARNNTRVHVLHRKEKQGLGPAYINAYRFALDHGFSWIAQMDADGSHRPEQFSRLLSAAFNATQQGREVAVIGSRWVKGGALNGWASHREVLSRTGNLYVSVMLRLGVHDATAGFRLYNADVIKRLDLDAIDSAGYCFQIDMTRTMRREGCEIIEVPITFDERRLGTSKMSSHIIIEALAQVTRWSMHDIMSKLRNYIHG